MLVGEIKFPHRRLLPEEAKTLGYTIEHVREDDGTVQSMLTANQYRVAYGAPSYASAVRMADAILANRMVDTIPPPPAVPASIPDAGWRWDELTLEQRAVQLALAMAGVKCKNKYPVGVIGREARAHYNEARHIAQAIEARQGGDAKQAPSQDESAVHAPKPSGILTENAG